MAGKKSRRQFLRTAGGLSAGLAISRSTASASARIGRPGPEPRRADALTAPPLDLVRVGMVGTGSRGSGHTGRLLAIDGVEIKAICDPYAPATQRNRELCTLAGRPEPDSYSKDNYDYRRLLDRDDIDIVVISTPWEWHARQAVDAMKAGKHAFIEVPAALTIDECWELVETSEKTQRHCMMMENTCYGREELMVLNMCRHGVFGELLHGKGAYNHDLRYQMKEIERGTGSWRTPHHTNRNGNLYPTHGLGPIAQYMNINRGDRFQYLTSMSTPAMGRARYANEHFPPDHARNRTRYICGDLNVSLIKTARGRTIQVEYDTTTPRPYDRINLLQGTKGIFRGYPNRVTIEGRNDPHAWADLEDYYSEFDHPLWTQISAEAERRGAAGHGGMDFVMTWRLISCLRNGEPLDQDVYDAASWSVVSALTEQSVAHESRPVDFPDFTRGRWQTMKPLGIVS